MRRRNGRGLVRGRVGVKGFLRARVLHSFAFDAAGS